MPTIEEDLAIVSAAMCSPDVEQWQALTRIRAALADYAALLKTVEGRTSMLGAHPVGVEDECPNCWLAAGHGGACDHPTDPNVVVERLHQSGKDRA